MRYIAQDEIIKRVEELVSDGYLTRGASREILILTPKGLMVLCAQAERPIKKSGLKKEQK